jgi:hypothetical protein
MNIKHQWYLSLSGHMPDMEDNQLCLIKSRLEMQILLLKIYFSILDYSISVF